MLVNIYNYIAHFLQARGRVNNNKQRKTEQKNKTKQTKQNQNKLRAPCFLGFVNKAFGI